MADLALAPTSPGIEQFTDAFRVMYACPHASDHAAIRRAQSLAAESDKVEVWRGLDCIYAAPMDARLAS